jgi:uncharacterized SAM-binding protein YcdF (DUF218 family)
VFIIVIVLLAFVPLFLLGYKPLKYLLSSYLNTVDLIPQGTTDALYVLGGSSYSTYKHLIAAANLYRNKKTRCILLFNNTSKSRYDPKLQRHLTTNEWAIRNLVDRGVPDSVITVIPVSDHFFGTMSEARDLSVYFKNMNFHSVILMSSPAHSRRVLFCFKYYLMSSKIRVYSQGSDDQFGMRELVLEIFKLQIYKVVMFFF